MQHPGWVLVMVGLLITGVGVIWLWGSSLFWFGRLPGDIVIEREQFRFYFPLATCILLSLLLSAVLWIVRYFTS